MVCDSPRIQQDRNAFAKRTSVVGGYKPKAIEVVLQELRMEFRDDPRSSGILLDVAQIESTGLGGGLQASLPPMD